MEANEYFSTYDALHDESNEPGRLSLNLVEACGLSKMVWSSFDFMTGPELRFVWEVTPTISMSPINLSGEGSINDSESLDSSISVQSAQYEDIDDPLQAELTAVDLTENMLLSDSAFHFFDTSSELGDLPYLEDFMTESRSTTTLTNTTTSTCTLNIPSEHRSSSSDTTQTSPCNHLGDFGTPVVENQDLSNVSQNAKDEEKAAQLPFGESYDYYRFESEFKQNPVITSCVDSGVGGTISTHSSELSGLCQSPFLKTSCSKRVEDEQERWSLDGDDLNFLLDAPFDAADDIISDEVFVSKFVLAEQICCTQLPSNPLMHKLTIVPSRRLMVASFIFSSDESGGRHTLHAISFLFNHRRCDWFMTRQNLFESALVDFIPRIKASLTVEEWDDVIIRTTAELSTFVNVLGLLDRFPLSTPNRAVMIKNTLFSRRKCFEDKLLAKIISGVLQSQGYCIVIGSNYSYVSRLLNTISLFLSDEIKWCCIRGLRHEYSPYFRVQAIHRSELTQVIQSGIFSNWSVCIADVDRGTVCMSAPYGRHRALRLRAEIQKIQSVLNNGAMGAKPVKLELRPCKVLDTVKEFLKYMDNLPMEESPRMGFVNQFMLYIENVARALIQYVKDSSMPLPDEKENAIKSKRFSLSDCQKALDLQSESWFHAVLARAELIQPDIADFLFM